MDYKKRASELVARMSLDEKASLLSGADFWHTKEVRGVGVKQVFMADGPHGLRKVKPGAREGDLNSAVTATCFPTACLSACSFDRDELFRMGRSIARECSAQGVHMILGPGINIKRNPLCGRNFEYFSEDPYLSGELAIAFTEGTQSAGVSSCIKHFALNSQEDRRFVNDSVCDERAMREIYLSGFERALKSANPPSCVMSSYNSINGVTASENKRLLTDILRTEWGFDGLVVSDWGSVDDRVSGVVAGLDLEMPSSHLINDREIIAAVKSGRLSEDDVDACARRMVEFSLSANSEITDSMRKPHFDESDHYLCAKNIAASSIVLLKNDESVLPLKSGERIALIGEMAVRPRYQGSGSSKISPFRLDDGLSHIQKRAQVTYAPGYSLDTDATDETLIADAVAAAKQNDYVIAFIGLPDRYESEGFDRANMRLPDNQLALMDALTKANKNVIVLLSCGAVVELPFEQDVRAMLLCYLGGEAVYSAAADIIFGETSPCGKLAESWPYRYSDVPSAGFYPGAGLTSEYRESIYVGYRYYQKANVAVRYPFGYGLSYSSFEYTDMSVSAFGADEKMSVTLTLKNTEDTLASETAQLYIRPLDAPAFRPVRELKGFKKDCLYAGEKRTLEFELCRRDFARYDADLHTWVVDPGRYLIELGSSCEDIRISREVLMDGTPGIVSPDRDGLSWYCAPAPGTSPSDAEFELLLGRKPPRNKYSADEPVNMSFSLSDVQGIPFGRFMTRLVKLLYGSVMGSSADAKQIAEKTIMETPFRALSIMSNGLIKLDAMKKIVARLERGRQKRMSIKQ